MWIALSRREQNARKSERPYFTTMRFLHTLHWMCVHRRKPQASVNEAASCALRPCNALLI